MKQHRIGEPTFWREYQKYHGCSVEELMSAYCKVSPEADEIARMKLEREQ